MAPTLVELHAVTVLERSAVRDATLLRGVTWTIRSGERWGWVHGQLLPWRKPYTDADWARARAQLEQLGASALGDRSIQTLSEDEQQRVQIARAHERPRAAAARRARQRP